MIRKSPHILLPLALFCLLFVFWLFNYGPLQLTNLSVADCGLWAHNLYNYYLPEYEYVSRRLASGHFPLWNPFQACGFPTLAGLQGGVFYLPNILFLFMSAEDAISFSTLFHLCLAALFLYLLFRRLFPEAHLAGALLGALAFTFNPRMYEFVLFPGNYMTACWLPAGLYFSERIITKRTFASAAMLAFSIAMIFLAGFTQVTVYVYEIMGVFLLFRLVQRIRKGESWREVARILGLLTAAGITGALLAAPQLLPTYELVGFSARSTGTLTPQMSEVYGPHANAFLPWLKGMVNYSSVLSLVNGQHPIPPWSLFLLLVPFAFLRRHARSTSFFFLGVAVITFVLSLGTNTPFYRLYWEHFPTGNWFTTPIRLRLLFYFSLSLLAGSGLSSLLDGEVMGKLRGAVLLQLEGLLLIVSALFAAIALLFLKNWIFLITGVITVHLVLLLAIMMMTRKSRMREQRYLVILLIILISAESAFWYRNLVPFPIKEKPRENLYNSALAATLSSSGRIHIENGWGLGFYGSPRVPEKFGSLFQIPVTTNWEPLSLRSYQEFCNYMTGREWYYGRFQLAGRPFSEKMFDMLSAKYIVFSDAGKDWIQERIRSQPSERRYRLIEDMGTARVYEDLHALAYINFATGWELVKRCAEMRGVVENVHFDPRSTVILDAPLDGLSQQDPPVSLSENKFIKSANLDYEQVEIDVETPQTGIVWVSDCYYPGWRVWVDGAESTMLRVNQAFKGVYVLPGRHKITMKYVPASFRWGLRAGCVGIILLLCQLLSPLLRRRKMRLRKHRPSVGMVPVSSHSSADNS